MLEAPIVDLVIALGLGLLVGLQRESADSRAAGLRTFALVTLSGAVAALLGASSIYLVPAGVLAVAAIAAVSHYAMNQHREDAGVTTEVALILMFLIGAYVVEGDRSIAVVLGGGVAVLLQAKGRFRWIMERLGADDVRAIMQFALLSLVILPVLPDRNFGPWGVLNLQKIWLLVVLIVGINLGGYIVYKFFGAHAGTIVGGVLGGVISSTATTVSYARRSRELEESSRLATVVVTIATAVVLVRVLIEIGVVAPSLLRTAAAPFAIVFALAAAIALLLWWRGRDGGGPMPEQKNPTSPRPALFFAALYAVVLLAAAWARDRMGNSGLYLVAAVAGLTDVDAITLSTARLAHLGQLEHGQAWRVIMLAYISNLAFKIAIVAFAGARRLLVQVAAVFAVIAAAGGLLMKFWP